jgi:hypothetical protein
MRLVLVYLFFLQFSSIYHAAIQQGYFVDIHVEDDQIIASRFKSDLRYDSITILHKINDVLTDLRSENYLLSNFDSISYATDTCKAFIFIDPRVSLGEIRIDEAVSQWVNPNAWGKGNYAIDSSFFSNYLIQIQKKLINSG